MSDQDWSAGKCPRTRRVVHFGHAADVRCNARSCPSCGKLWLGDTRVRVLAACQALGRAVALVSVTAPGQRVLPWAPGGKVVDPDEARRWNEAAPERWASLHRRAARIARREAAKHGIQWRLYVKVWEYQKRGVLHLHLIVPCGSSAERAASEAYVAALVSLGPSEGFGYVDRGKLPTSGPRRSVRELSPVSPHRAAAYVASYVTSTGAGKEGIAEVARKQGVPGAVVYVAYHLTRRSNVTMRSLRARRRLLMQFPDASASRDHWRAATVVDGLRRSRAQFSPEDRQWLFEYALDSGWTFGLEMATGEVFSPTPAALPPPVSDAVGPGRSPGSAVFFRLDCVTHHGLNAADHRVLWSHLACIRPSIPG